MRPAIFVIGLAIIAIGGYPPFNLLTVIAGLCVGLYGLFSKKGKKR